MSNQIIDKNGTKRWFNKDGQAHRVDGPAVESVTGQTQWWSEGVLHREDGPAVEGANNSFAWYYNGHLICNINRNVFTKNKKEVPVSLKPSIIEKVLKL
jgi:hypothetical protein